MKRVVRILLNKSVDSLVLSIELFNRPIDKGRTHSVLILLDHAFEMLLKAALLHRGVGVYDKKTKQTIGFDSCVRKAIGNGAVRFLTDEQALTLQAINGMRDAEQHYYLEISEDILYTLVQSGFTLFRDILEEVFNKELNEYMPRRVLPVSTTPPKNLEIMFEEEVESVKTLLKSKGRKKSHALAKLHSLQIIEKSLQGDRTPVIPRHLTKIAKKIEKGEKWPDIFPGLASVSLTSEPKGHLINLRFTKKEGIPIHTVPEGTPGAMVVGLRRVNELSFYSMGRNDLAKKLGLTGPKTSAAIWYFDIQDNPDCYKLITIGKSKHKRYSPKTIEVIKEGLKEVDIDKIWHEWYYER
ncbi:MAG: hypothetical protein PHU95_04090 [Candidatus Thermoplasmatota archaeon]|nr:hypothetical protein [Candidatus Thermoplasmatota archaeon]